MEGCTGKDPMQPFLLQLGLLTDIYSLKYFIDTSIVHKYICL